MTRHLEFLTEFVNEFWDGVKSDDKKHLGNWHDLQCDMIYTT